MLRLDEADDLMDVLSDAHVSPCTAILTIVLPLDSSHLLSFRSDRTSDEARFGTRFGPVRNPSLKKIPDKPAGRQAGMTDNQSTFDFLSILQQKNYHPHLRVNAFTPLPDQQGLHLRYHLCDRHFDAMAEIELLSQFDLHGGKLAVKVRTVKHAGGALLV